MNHPKIASFIIALLLAQSAFAYQLPKTTRWNPEASPDSGIISERIYKDGFLVKTLTAQGITIIATGAVNGKYLQVLVAVGNNSQALIDVLPERVFVDNIAKSKPLKPVAVERVARDIEKKAESAAGWAMAGAWMFLRNRTVSNTDSRGSVYGNATVIGPNGSATGTLNGGYSENSTTTTTTPNRQAQQWVYERSQNKVEQAHVEANDLREMALLANTLAPQSATAGLLLFEFDKSAKEILIRIPLGGNWFEIPFTAAEIGR